MKSCNTASSERILPLSRHRIKSSGRDSSERELEEQMHSNTNPADFSRLASSSYKYVELQPRSKVPVGVPLLDAEGNPVMRPRRAGGARAQTTWRILSFEDALTCVQAGGNVGVILGRATLVVDIDPARFPPGRNVLREFLQRIGRGDFKAYPAVRTSSKGLHIYTSVDPELLLCGAHPDFPGIDFKRGDRSYVVAPGCVHPSGIAYTFANAVSFDALPPAPQGLLDLLAIEPPKRSGPKDADVASDWGSLDEEQLEDALSHIDVEQFNHKNDDWVRFAMSCHWLTAGDGREVFLDWCAGDDEYSDEAMRDINGQRWDSFGKESKRGGAQIHGGLLFKYLRAAGVPQGQWPQRSGSRDFGDVMPEENEALFAPPPNKSDRVVDEMNARHPLVMVRGKPFYIEEGSDDFHYMTRGDIANRYEHETVTVIRDRRPTDVKKGEYWLEHPRKKVYERALFEPGKPREFRDADGKLTYNLWKGWAVDPEGANGSWTLTRRLIHDALAGGDAAAFNYILDWLAYSYQRPRGWGPQGVVFVLRDDLGGTGKGTLGRIWRAPFGMHGRLINQKEGLLGRFSDHLEYTAAVQLDEPTWTANRDQGGLFKSIITEPSLDAEGKGLPRRNVPNHLAIMITTNAAWAAPADIGDRRFFTVDVLPTFKGDRAFWQELNAELEEGGYEAFFREMLARKLGDFHPEHDRVETIAMGVQRRHTVGPFADWWIDCLESGVMPGALGDWRAGPVKVISEASRTAFHSFAGNALTGDWRYGFANKFGNELRRVCPNGYRKSQIDRVPKESRGEWPSYCNADGRAQVFVLPDLEACRDRAERLFGVSFADARMEELI